MGVVDDAARISNAPAFLCESAQLWYDYDYIKEFTTILLEIVDVPDKDALFYFIDGLNEWARIEINGRNVKTLDEAIAAAKSIVDYSNRPRTSDKQSRRGKNPNKELDDHRDGVLKFKRPFQKRNMSKPPPKPCFICDGPNWTGDCPRCLGSLREMLSGVETKEHRLLFTELTINNKNTLGLIDTGATYNFLDVKEAEQLGVTYNSERGTTKTVKLEPKQIHGMAKA
ncbi:reverse transcriptase [Tanacetum coccineum]